jgi:hypothetical protein
MATKKRRVVEQGVGGPGTVRGVNFQLKYAILRAFKAVQLHLAFPLYNPVIQPEPRAGHGEFATGWDLRISLPENLAEVNLIPHVLM